MQSLNMLVVTEGRERTVTEYECYFAPPAFRKLIAATPARRSTQCSRSK